MRYWSLLYLVGILFCIALFVYAPLNPEWWLPDYGSTNQEALGRLNQVEAQLGDLARRQEQIGEQVRQQDPKSSAPAALAPIEHDQAEVLDALRQHQRVLEDLASQTFLLPMTREAADSVAKTVEELTRVREALQQGQAQAASEPQQAALADLQAANQKLGVATVEAGQSVSEMGREVDHLFVLILWITGLVFLGTQFALVWATWNYSDRPGRKAEYFHGSQRLEVIWTIIPSAVLVFIALYQMGTWADIKFRSAMPRVRPTAEITARQFQWAMRYPGPDGRLETRDDLQLVNDLHFVKGEKTLIYLKSSDVLHSFFLPQMRVKQDAVPGMTIPVWFDADKSGHYELVCAELCGWGHYKMRGKVTVHESREDFEEWMENALREQNRDQPPAPVAVAIEGR